MVMYSCLHTLKGTRDTTDKLKSASAGDSRCGFFVSVFVPDYGFVCPAV